MYRMLLMISGGVLWHEERESKNRSEAQARDRPTSDKESRRTEVCKTTRQTMVVVEDKHAYALARVSSRDECKERDF